MVNIVVNRKACFAFNKATNQAHDQSVCTIANHLYDIWQDILHCIENIMATDLVNFARWSFGVLLWEIVTLSGMSYPSTPANRILSLLNSGYRMEELCNCGVELYNLMSLYRNVGPQRRSIFAVPKRSLDKLLSSYSENEYLSLSDIVRGSGKSVCLMREEPVYQSHLHT